jgi:hypothetical protein
MNLGTSSQTLVSASLIFAVAIAVYGRLLIPGEAPYSPHSDIVPQRIAVKAVLKDALEQEGALPFWRHDQMAGGPAATQPQALYTYPFHFLFWLVSPLDAVGPTFFLHLLLAAFGCFVIGSVIGLSAPARCVMGLAGLLSFKLILAVYAGWQPIVPALALLPWFFAAVIGYTRLPNLPRLLFAAVVFALSLHTGALQYFHFALLVMIPYVLFEVVSNPRQHSWRQRVHLILGLLSAGVLGVGLSFYLWLPVAQDMSLLSRTERTFTFFLSGHALGPAHLLTFFYPHALGSPLDSTYAGVELWEDVAYFGAVPLALAIYAVVALFKKRTVRFFAVAFVATALLAFETPLLRLVYHVVPGYDLFRCPARMLFVTAYMGIALAGYGSDALLERLGKTKIRRRWRYAFLSAVLIAMTTEGWAYAQAYIQTVPHRYMLPELPYLDALKQAAPNGRIATLGRWTVNYGWAAPKRVQLISGYDPYILLHYRRFFYLMQDGDFEKHPPGVWLDLNRVKRLDLLDALNVHHLITPEPIEPGPGWSEVARVTDAPTFQFYRGMTKNNLWIYRRRKPLGRAFFVEKVYAVSWEASLAAALRKTDLKTAAVILVEEGGKGALHMSDAAPADRVRVLASRAGRLSLRTETANRRFLVISEVWHPGWTASLDGKPAPTYQTDLALLGIWVPGGAHAIEMVFEPPGWHFGTAVSGMAAAVWLLLLLFYVVRSRRAVSPLTA